MCLPTKTVFFFNKERFTVLLNVSASARSLEFCLSARQSILLWLCMIVEPCPAVLQSLKREPLVLYCTDYRLARKTIKYIGLLVALLPRSKTNKNTIFKVLYLLVGKTRNAKLTWQHTIDGYCDGVNRRNFHVQCKTSLACYKQKMVRNCLIFCPRSQKHKIRSVTPKAATWFQRPKLVSSWCRILWNHTANLLSVCSFENISDIKYKQSQNNRN